MCKPHDDNALKKSEGFTLLLLSNDGKLLKIRGNVAIVFAPFSNNFCLYFPITIKSYFIIFFLFSKYLFEYNGKSDIFFKVKSFNYFFIYFFLKFHKNLKLF